MLPLFRDSEGRKLNSIQYADMIFNQLSKGSSWFVPQVLSDIENYQDSKALTLKARIANERFRQIALLELKTAGVEGIVSRDGTIVFTGNLAAILKNATEDSAAIYKNDEEFIEDRYKGIPPLQITEAWWHLLSPLVKSLEIRGENRPARLIEEVIKRAIEPGNNFYGLPSARVADNILLICALLAFYVIYALWYGFAIYHLFAGFGLLGEEEAIENVEESEI